VLLYEIPSYLVRYLKGYIKGAFNNLTTPTQDNDINCWSDGCRIYVIPPLPPRYQTGAHYAAMFGAAPKFEISKHSLQSNVVEPMNDNENSKLL